MARFSDLLSEGGAISAPGVHDALTALIAARAGHRALYLGGNAMALGLGKGQPFLTLTETAALTTRIARAIDLPLLVDAGAGFGAGSHLRLAVRELEAAGAAAIHLDDQPYPKLAGYHRGAGTLVAAQEMAARIALARSTRREMLVIARTDALRVTKSIDETITRAQAYAAAGADALIVLDLDPARARAVRAALPDLPLLWIGGVAPPVPSRDDLAAAGFAMALYPFSGIAALTVALADVWRGLAETGRTPVSDETLARARTDTLALVDMAASWAIEDQAT
jgi:methylisocitrate lyase